MADEKAVESGREEGEAGNEGQGYFTSYQSFIGSKAFRAMVVVGTIVSI